MNLDSYPIISSDDLLTHDFISNGPQGSIWKRIEFQLSGENRFNLAFGDWTEDKKIDDTALSNNNDREKILATVAKAVVRFLQIYPTAQIEAQGSTSSRTRLYQMKIFQYLNDIQAEFIVCGKEDGDWELFDQNKRYAAFLLIKKQDSYEKEKTKSKNT